MRRLSPHHAFVPRCTRDIPRIHLFFFLLPSPAPRVTAPFRTLQFLVVPGHFPQSCLLSSFRQGVFPVPTTYAESLLNIELGGRLRVHDDALSSGTSSKVEMRSSAM